MKRETLAKMAAEEPLDVAESLALDAALAEGPSLAAGLADHEPSLAWRSELNARLEAVARPRRASRRWYWLGGLAAAAAASAMVMVRPLPSAPALAEAEIEAALAKAVGESEASASAGVAVPDWGG